MVTPNNKYIFLYDRVIYGEAYDEKRLGDLLIASDWNVYVRNDHIIYINSECSGLDNPFLLHIFPLDANDLDDKSGESSFNNRDFRFEDFEVRRGAPCVASALLPDYAIARIRTGQYDAVGELWSGEFALSLE